MTQPATKRLVSEARLNDAVAAAVAAPADTAIASAINNPSTQTRSALDGRLPYIDVELQRQTGDTDDAIVFQRAVNAAKTFGSARIVAKGKSYTFNSYVNLGGVNGLVIEGVGKNNTTIYAGQALNYAFTAFTDCSNITFRHIGFKGTAVDDATSPRRSRTFTGHSGFAVAIKMQGDLTVGNTPKITNVTLDTVRIEGTSTLPVLLSGIRGEAKITNSSFYNNMDVGFIFCESAVFTNNWVRRSADNGVSLSRGNTRVVCVGNNFENCCYWAVWIAGFNGDAGPTDVVVSGNVGANLGYGGVCADSAPQNFNITGNTFRNALRGPSDGATDSYGVGVFVSGMGDSSAPTVFAQNFTISGNTLIDCSRGGVLVRGCKNGGVYGNVIVRPGTQYLSDGTTVITTATATQNFGIAADANYASTVTNVDVQDNVIIDDRATPYLNNATYSGTSPSMWVNNNRATGNRLQMGETARTISGGGYTFAGGIVTTGGFRTGSDTSTANTSAQINGAALSNREVFYTTASKRRWSTKANASAESGSNAGSDWQLDAYDDAGNYLSTPVSALRQTGIIVLGGAMRLKVTTTTARPTAASVGQGSVMYDSTLGKPIYSTGSAWTDSTGAAV